jgi:hypothetical protein
MVSVLPVRVSGAEASSPAGSSFLLLFRGAQAARLCFDAFPAFESSSAGIVIY